MPFRSEKQRRYLWAKHPDIAKRWAKEYPESNKNLPMYKKDKPEEDKPVNKAAALKSLHSALVNNLSDFKNSSCLQDGSLNLKKADSKLTHIKMPKDEKPTYAGEKQTESILKPETEDEGSVGDLRRQERPKNVTNPLLNKLAVVLAPKIQQELEDLKAQQEARNAQRVPENVNVKQYPVASATIPPPMGMTQAPQAPQQPAQPQQDPAQAQNGQLASVGGGSSPNANPINSFGGLSSTGDINGNAAFGTANGMGGEKLAKNSNNAELQQLLQQWEAQGGSQSAYPMSAHSKVPPAVLPKELAAKLQQHLKYPKHIVPDEFDAAEALLALEEAQQPQKLAAQKCSCGCGQTVADCSCPVSCSCRQKGSSCYGKKTAAPKKASLDISQLLQDLNPVDSDELNPDELVESLTPVKPQEPNMAAIAAILGTSGTLEYLAGKTKSRPTMKQAAGDEMQAELMGMDHIEPDEIAELMERTKQAVDKWAGKQLGLWDRIRAKKQRGEKPAKPGDKDYPDSKSWNKVTAISEKKSADDKPEPKPPAAEKKKPSRQPSLLTTGLIGAAGGLGGGLISQLLLSKLRKGSPVVEKQSASPAWQRAAGKNEAGGLNEKGRKSYEREHGGNLKAPVTESNPSGERAKRQNSFCSRMCGMKSVNTGAKTKSDPDSRINKSLRKWNCKCSSASEFGFKLAYDIGNRRQSTNVQDLTGNLKQPSRLTGLLGETPGTAVLPRNWSETKDLFKNEFDRIDKSRDFFMQGIFNKPTPQATAVMNYADKLTDAPPPPMAERARSFATKYVPGAGRAMNQISPQAAPPTPANHPIANAVKDVAKKYPVTLPSVK